MKDQISETEAAVTEDKTEVKTADLRKENIGKFPNKEELYAAYNALEKEFTRRSQRLKTLERQIDDLNKASLRKEENAEKAAKFLEQAVENYPSLLPLKSELAEALAAINPEDETSLWKIAFQVVASAYRSPDDIMADEDFLNERVYSNDDVLTACAETFFGAKSGAKSPRTVGSCGRAVITLPKKPSSLKEAKEMAEHLFK